MKKNPSLLSKTKKAMIKINREISLCVRCSLFKSREKTVPGEGNIKPKVFFIGEAPGNNEDKSGRPFCGAAGKVLDRLFNSIDLTRKEAYITNLVKCHPPQNRKPKELEMEICSHHYLERQLKLIKPEIICTLGNSSTVFMFKKLGLGDKLENISKIRGKIFNVAGGIVNAKKIVPLFHPAVAVYNPNNEGMLKKDFKILKNFLKIKA